jgi:hypothetical protein
MARLKKMSSSRAGARAAVALCSDTGTLLVNNIYKYHCNFGFQAARNCDGHSLSAYFLWQKNEPITKCREGIHRCFALQLQSTARLKAAEWSAASPEGLARWTKFRRDSI